jgi:hypothetical protein
LGVTYSVVTKSSRTSGMPMFFLFILAFPWFT